MSLRHETYDSSTQTLNFSSELDLDTKLELIEQQHKVHSKSESNGQAYQRLLMDMQQRFKSDLENEVTRIREVELNLCRSQESSKWQLRFEKFRDELEAVFNTRLSDLQDKELKLMDTYTVKCKELEAKLFQAKEKLTQDSNIASRELQYDRKNNEYDKSCLDRSKEELDRKERELNKRQKELDRLEEIYEERLQQQMEIYKTVTLKDIREKKILLETKISKINDELEKVTGMQSRMTELSERNKNLELKLGTSDDQNRQLEDKARAVSRELDNLRDTLSLQNQNYMRSEAAVERLNLQLKSKSDEVEHLKILNQQLRDMVEMNRKETILMEDHRNAEERRLRNKISKMEEFIFKQDQDNLTRYFQQTDDKFDDRHADAVKKSDPVHGILSRLDQENKSLKEKKAKILEYLDKDEELGIDELKRQPKQVEVVKPPVSDKRFEADNRNLQQEPTPKTPIQYPAQIEPTQKLTPEVRAESKPTSKKSDQVASKKSEKITEAQPVTTKPVQSLGLKNLPTLPGVMQKPKPKASSSKDDFDDLDDVLDTPETPGKQYDWENKNNTATPNKLDKSKCIFPF